MSAALNAAVAALKEKLGGGGFDGSVKFDIEGEGAIRIAGDQVDIDDADADCTISGALDTFQELFSGELDPTAAFMAGKIRIDGDMGTAMKLSGLLG